MLLILSVQRLLSVGVEGHLSRLSPGESLRGGSERKVVRAQQTAKAAAEHYVSVRQRIPFLEIRPGRRLYVWISQRITRHVGLWFIC